MNILAISDIHTNFSKKLTKELNFLITKEKIDILISAGDQFSNQKNFLLFLNWFSQFNCKKIFISGNHDLIIKNNYEFIKKESLKKNIIYLEDEEIIIDGIKFYGSPWTVKFVPNSIFTKPDYELKKIWNKISDDTEVLITHSPPFSILDYAPVRVTKNYTSYYEILKSVGSYSLMEKILKLSKLKLHIFGHIHSGYGLKVSNNIQFVNASLLNNEYKIVNKPILIKI